MWYAKHNFYYKKIYFKKSRLENNKNLTRKRGLRMRGNKRIYYLEKGLTGILVFLLVFQGAQVATAWYEEVAVLLYTMLFMN